MNIKKIIIFLVCVGVAVFLRQIIFGRQNDPVWETSAVEKGTLITAVSASGTITAGNSTSITTKVSGVVKTVWVTNGDRVTKGQKIADVITDEYAAARQASAWVAYQGAQEAVKTAQKDKMSGDLAMWEGRQAILDAEEDIDYMIKNPTNPDTGKDWTPNEKTVLYKTLAQTQKAFEEAELKYKNADSRITEANAKIASAWRDYQENSATIYAPAEGVISDLALAQGVVINASSTTSSSTGATIVSSQTVGKIAVANGQLMATVGLAEIDVIRVKANQKATLTLDAYPDKTFTGKVLAVNTAGTVASGVTSYPVSILLDPVEVEIYPNMAVNAQIIESIKNDIILVPTTAITTVDNQSTVQVKKDDKVSTVVVQVGSANDSQTEIISGVSQGDEVIIQVINPENSEAADTTSPFGGMGRTGGANIRISGPGGGF